MKLLVSFILSMLFILNLEAENCVSFEGVKNKKIVQPIREELQFIGVKSKVNAKNSCDYKVYLPIDVYVKNESGSRQIEIHFMMQKKMQKLEEKTISYQDKSDKIYNIVEEKNNLKSMLIKEHSKLIANSIEKEII